MKARSKITDHHKAWMVNEMRSDNFSLSVGELLVKFQDVFPELQVSHSVFYRCLRHDLGFRFRKVLANPSAKNAQANKEYRFWWVHKFMKLIKDDAVLVSIDESSVSTYNTTPRKWINEAFGYPVNNSMRTNSGNISLLLAASQFGIIGYYLAEGSINTAVYVDFMVKLFETLADARQRGQRVVYLMDNCSMHRSQALSAVVEAKKMEVLYTAKYSPEVHFIEYLFCKIKEGVRRRGVGSSL